MSSETPISRMMARSRTHARSASHGGVGNWSTAPGKQSQPGNLNWVMPPMTSAGPRPSALKKPGHQRAHSHGQVVEVSQPVSGHQRVGSKTDFILPPGHREEPSSREAPARPATGKVPSFRGHSRQASR